MKPGHGEVVLAEGDVEVAEDEERLVEEFRRQLDLGMWAAVPTTAGGGPPRGAHGHELRRRPARRRARHLLPARRRRRLSRAGEASRDMALALGATAIVIVALLWDLVRPGRRRGAGRAAAPAAPRVPTRGLRPGPRAPRRAARPPAPALLRQRRGVGDVPRPGLRPGLGRAGHRARPGRDRGHARRRALRLPRLPPQADRRLPAPDARAAQRVLRRRSRTRRARTARRGCPTATTCWRSGWR